MPVSTLSRPKLKQMWHRPITKMASTVKNDIDRLRKGNQRRLQDIAILIFKAVNGMLPGCISDLFVVRNNVKCLRGTNKLVVLYEKTTNFGLKSTTFIGAKVEFLIG